jgi:hypothetical protein
VPPEQAVLAPLSNQLTIAFLAQDRVRGRLGHQSSASAQTNAAAADARISTDTLSRQPSGSNGRGATLTYTRHSSHGCHYRRR